MNVKMLCEIAGASRSGYYKWLQSADESERDYDDYLLVKEMFEQGKRKYGFRTIQMKLKTDKNVVMNHKKIIRIMNKYHLYTKIRRVNPYRQIMKKTKEHRTCANLLGRNFRVIVPYKIFCTDITYLPYNRRLAYLSVIKDIATGEIVGWHLAGNLTMPLVINTIKNMENNKRLPITSFENIMIHSDQGFHYTHPAYIKKIKGLKMVQSMSRKGNCIDNAPVESFFGHLKDDIDYRGCKTFEELRQLITEYMHYYNYGRYQWNLKKMTPACYRNHLLVACR
jgi:transposase InsO family protein